MDDDGFVVGVEDEDFEETAITGGADDEQAVSLGVAAKRLSNSMMNVVIDLAVLAGACSDLQMSTYLVNGDAVKVP